MANNIARVPHLIGTNKIVVLEDIYDEIGDICGIVKLEDDPPDDASTYKSPRFLTESGVIRRAKVKLENKKIRTIYMLAANCPKIGALVGKEYTTGISIKTAYFPARYTFG